jgi:hypothetical protein
VARAISARSSFTDLNPLLIGYWPSQPPLVWAADSRPALGCRHFANRSSQGMLCVTARFRFAVVRAAGSTLKNVWKRNGSYEASAPVM